MTASPLAGPLDLEREWPLSHAQRRIWWMEQREPGTCLGNVAGVLHAHGPVEVPRLAEAVRLFIAHTPTLRLRFFAREGTLLQRFSATSERSVEVLDFSGSDSPRDARARWCEAAATTPFPLLGQPLYRFAVLREGPEDVLLFANVHHLIGDAVSLGLFAREVSRLYARLGGASPAAGAPCAIYPDLILEERRYLDSEVAARDGAAWRERFASFDSPSTLGRPACLRPSTKATRHSRHLEPAGTRAVQAFARREGVTLARLFTVLGAVFVGRVSGKQDVCLGTYTHNRFSREQLGMFGMFVGTLPLRFQLEPSETLSSAMGRGSLLIQKALKTARYPYDRLLEDLKHPGALFDVVVSHQTVAYGKTLDGAPVRIHWLFNGHEAHALAIHISDRVDEGLLTLDFDFRDDGFAPGVPEQLVESFLHLLRSVVESPGTRTLAELSLVAPRQWEALHALNPAAVAFPSQLQVQQLFEQAARAWPHAVAVRSGEEVLTYEALEAKASVLAARLQSRGVGPGTCVGLWTGRTPDLLVSLLGILKSGACYLPIDPSYPSARIEFLMKDANVRALVVDAGTVVPEGAFGVELVRLGEASDAPRPLPAREGASTDLAYILYTSGSSGQPKGVMLEHRSVVNFLTGMMHALPLEGVRRVLCATTVSFDIFVLETLLPLALGREVLLASEEAQRDPGALAALISRERPGLVQLTPSRLQLLLEHPHGLEALRSVSLLLVGGESLPPLVLEKLGALTATRVFNMYGPTETTVWSTCSELTGQGLVHVGRPIQNTQVFIVDARGELLPRGVIGEVCIGGEGVARGYLNRPELQAERFWTPTFTSGRFYRTGDLGHWLPTGELVLLGRVDAQLKIRGHRIEPGEVEAQILRTGEVSAVAVLGRADRTGVLSLVAFYVPRSGAAAPREALRAVLPPYMVPARWVALEALPALPSGKIDRKALSRIELPDLREHESVAPANDVEERLLGLWRDVLGVSGFGVTDDFFDLGGHSLGAIALVNRIDAELGHRLAVSDVFAHPTIRGLAARLAGAGRDGLALPTPVVLATQDVYAVTPLQKTMYAVHVRAGADNTGHHMTGALRVNGALEPTRLQEAFERLIQRHEALRTSFESDAGEVVQRVHAEVPFVLEQLPATGCSLDDLVTGFVRPFDPGRAPLLRAGLCRASAEEATLVVDLHHLIADGASTGILLEELAVLLSGESLSEASLQPKEFAAWRARVRDSAVGEAAVAYWKDRFAEPPSPLELPTDRPRPSAPSFDADTWTMALPEPLTRRLLARCQEARVTPFVFLLAAYELLLARHAASPEVVVVTPVLGRAHPAFARSVGLFVSTVALRSALQEEVSVRELLTTLATRTREALDHPELPLEQLLAAGAARGGRGLGDVLFTLAEEEEAPVGVAGGVTLRRLAPSIRTAQYDLELTAALTASPSLTLRWTYKTSLFERARVEAMAERYARLLEGLLEDLSRPLQAVSMLTPGDVLALSASQGPVVEHPPRTLARLFEEQADRTPDAPALEFEGERLTYRQLDAWTNQLAHRLVALGVGPNVRVGVCLERSFELVVSLLAVTKAGGAYVPLDPSYPEKRLAFMLEDARPPVLLIQERLRSRFADFTGALLTVGASAAGSSERLPSRADVDDLAYVIYTSGSTGQPKGAMNAHRGISNRLQWMQARYGLTPDDAVLQKTPFSFDVSVWEFFWTLMTGARLVIARPEGHQDPTYLAELIAARGVTTLHFVPSMLEAFVGEGAPARCPSLRRVLCSGEALSFSLQQRFFAQAPAHVQLHNLYGPTEAAVDVSAWECERQPTRPLVPIGRPIDNVRLHNLDPYMNPVPADVRGELYIGGVAVGLGYLGRPELTAQRFVRDPFSSSPEARLYRTGDRCRVLADGAVDYLGRIDGQIKLRGFRIELGEIEAVLTQHPSLAEGAVLLREDAPGHPRLVGYVRPQEPSGFSLEPLQAHLRANLPAHMVPSAWVVLRALPVTPNGKLDRAALPPPEASHEAHVPPRGATEERLAALWMELLGVSRVGRDDDFFALGGHSLLATRLASRIRATFLVDLSLRALFDLGTLKAQAERIDGGAEAVQEAPITRAPDALRHQLSFAQQRLWFLSQLEPGSPLYNIAGVARLRGNLEVATLSRVLELQVARHEVFRTSFAAVDGVPRATVAEHVPFTLTCLDMSGRSSAEVDAWVSEECRRPFDLAQAPLFRATLLRRSEQEHLLVLVMHHIISDGWSLGGLLRELGALYAAPASSGAPPALQYLDYAVWEREQLSGPRFERELEHWKQRLGLHPAVLELPTDRTRPTVQTFRGALLQTRLSGELTRALTTLSHEAGGTLFMTLLAGFKTLLFRYTRQSELIVGTPIANRTRAETEAVVGCFVNTLALKTKPRGDMTFAQLLAEVRDVTLDAYAHQHVPFEKIVEVVKPARDLSRSPLVQVMFSLENVPEARTSLSGLSLEPLELDTGSARFDLSLSVMPRPEGLALTYEYNTDLFDRSTLERMHGHLETLLTAAVRAPHTRLGALDLLTGGELRRLLDFEPGPSREASSGATSFVDLFERQVALRPDALALRQGARDLSYEELNTRANQLAHVLRARGVGPEILVAVCLERSVEAVVAFLAIFKAGGAYVPLDPSHPPERLGLILREARALCALTSRALVDKLQGCGLQTLPMEDLEDEVRQAPRSNPEGERPPESLAYVIYTSGSTGQPKGVMVSHRNLATFLESMAALYRLVPEDRMLQFASLSVDTSVMELYPPLIVGGAAVLRTEEMMNSVSTYLESCERWGVTFIKPPTSYWSEMTFALSLGDARMPPSVRLVGVGGEKMQPGRAIEWKRLVDPRVRLYNEYGPTETTVMMTACDITALDEVRLTHAEAPLGMPLAHARVSLLDPEGRRVPVGVPGELCVGGVLVTRGYQDRPDLTAQLFVPDAFSDVPGARMYRSGDKARWWPEGSLEYLGRLDEQVKIRGFRVEPGEVEALLNAHASVREAAVVVRDDAQGQKHLVAFVVVEDAAVDAAALKGYLRERVPDYMLPSRIVLMPDLPIGPSDKIERSALPLVALHGADDREYVAPRTEAEQRLAEIWCTVLQVERVGANDHFFDLGGHSLLATQLVSRVRQAFGVEIPLTLLFEKPTVAALAEDLERRARANTGPQLRKLSRADLKNRKPRG